MSKAYWIYLGMPTPFFMWYSPRMSDYRTWLMLAALALTVAFGCEVNNKNSVTCHDGDCAASCQTLGYHDGACDGEGECVCAEADAGPYDWDNGGDTDADTDSATDTDG